jgi:glc operon protein GlcG
MKTMFYLVILTVALAAAPLRADDPSEDDAKSLVRRNRVSLTLAGAEMALAAAQEKAKELKLNVNITVVDEGGHPIAFARMDGARPASVYTSMTKAATAATARTATGPLPPGKPADAHLSLAVESAARASGGKFTTLKGGIPIIIDDQVIGAVGVGGATGEQDAMIAQAGVDALAQAVNGENGPR